MNGGGLEGQGPNYRPSNQGAGCAIPAERVIRRAAAGEREGWGGEGPADFGSGNHPPPTKGETMAGELMSCTLPSTLMDAPIVDLRWLVGHSSTPEQTILKLGPLHVGIFIRKHV